MAIEHVPGHSGRANERDFLLKALLDIPPWLVFDYNRVLHHIAESAEFKQWFIPKIVESEGYDGYSITRPISWGRTFDSKTSRNESVRCFEFSFGTRPNLPNIRSLPDELRIGTIWIRSLGIDKMRIVYTGKNMAAFRFRCGIMIETQLFPHWINGAPTRPKPIWLGYYNTQHWSEPKEIQIEKLKLWIEGKHEDPDQGIEIILSDNLILQYPDTPPYPKQLYHLFRDFGPNALEKLRDHGCIDPETWQSISSRIEQNYPSSNSEIPGDHDLEGVSEAPHQETDPILAARIEAVEIPKEDREKIEIVDGVKSCKSYRKWAELLGYKAKSDAYVFFKRNEEKGLLVTKKGPGGIGIYAELTEKGKRVIGAF